VSLPLLRAMDDIAATLPRGDLHAKLLDRVRRVVAGCDDRMEDGDTARLRQRLVAMEQRLTG